jgi:hypothetical protein
MNVSGLTRLECGLRAGDVRRGSRRPDATGNISILGGASASTCPVGRTGQ